jgi:hypothetical protein
MQLQCRNSKNDTEALQIKDQNDLFPVLKAAKSSAKSVTVAQQECHLAQLVEIFRRGEFHEPQTKLRRRRLKTCSSGRESLSLYTSY